MPVDAVQVGQICLVRNTSVTNEYFIVDDCRQWQPAEQILEEADDLCRMTLEFSEMSLYTDASFNFIKNACIGENRVKCIIMAVSGNQRFIALKPPICLTFVCIVFHFTYVEKGRHLGLFSWLITFMADDITQGLIFLRKKYFYACRKMRQCINHWFSIKARTCPFI
jgi:hypothetical protein